MQSRAESRASNSAQADVEQQQAQQQQQQQQQQPHSSHQQQQQVITAAIEQGESSRQVKNSNVQSLTSNSYRYRFERDSSSGWKELGSFYMDANGRPVENPTPGTAQLNAGPGGLRLGDYLSRDAQPRTNT